MNLQGQYRFHKCPPPAPVLSQIDPVHSPTSHFLNNHFNITGSSKCSLSLRNPTMMWCLNFKTRQRQELPVQQHSVISTSRPSSYKLIANHDFFCFIKHKCPEIWNTGVSPFQDERAIPSTSTPAISSLGATWLISVFNRSRASQCYIYGGQSDRWKSFSSEYFGCCPYQYHSTSASITMCHQKEEAWHLS
jgi:hypothetical protein